MLNYVNKLVYSVLDLSRDTLKFLQYHDDETLDTLLEIKIVNLDRVSQTIRSIDWSIYFKLIFPLLIKIPLLVIIVEIWTNTNLKIAFNDEYNNDDVDDAAAVMLTHDVESCVGNLRDGMVRYRNMLFCFCL